MHLFFGVNSAQAAWYNNGWSKRIKIEVNRTQINGSVANYPVYVNLAHLDSTFFDNSLANGADLRVTKSDEVTELPREVVWMSKTQNAGELYFVANGILTNSANGVFYLYYGNGDATEPAANTTYGKNNVWVNSYVGVWHLHQTPTGSVLDSTVVGSNCTSAGSMASNDLVAGNFGYAIDFDDDDDYLSCGNAASIQISKGSLSAWINTASSTDTWAGIATKRNAYNMYLEGNTFAYWDFNAGAARDSNIDPTNSTWKYLTQTFNGTNAKINFFIDNASVLANQTFGISNQGSNFEIGRGGTTGQNFGGKIDEVRLSSVVRPISWIRTEYSNLTFTSNFYSVAAPYPDVIVPTVSYFSPGDGGGIAVSGDLVIVFSEVIDVQTGNITIKKSADDSIVEVIDVTSGQVTGDGTTTITINPSSDFSEATGYYVQIDATAFDDASGNSYAGIADTTTWNFTTPGWYNSGWSKRIKIEINRSQINGSVSNFPVYVNLNGMPASFFDDSLINGADLRVTKADGTTEVAREVVWLNKTQNAGELHFVANGTLTNAANGVFFIYYANGDATEPAANATYGKNNVWINGYAGVWHLNQIPSISITDSTATASNCTSFGSMVSGDLVANGNTGYALRFDDNDDYLSCGNAAGLQISKGTISAWINTASSSDMYSGIGVKRNGYNMYLESNTFVFWDFGGSGLHDSNIDPTNSTWKYLTETFNGTNSKANLFIANGIVLADQTFSVANQNSNFEIGRGGTTGQNFGGKIDEVRISNVVRPIRWIRTEYNNQSAPRGFYAIGSAELNTDTTAPTVSSFSPADDGTGVSVNSNLVINFYENVDIQTGNITIKKSSDNSTVQTIDVTSGYVTGNGTSQITINPPANLTENTNYYVLIDASAFDDTAGNSYAGIAASTTWNFTTVAGAAWYDKAWPYRVKVTVNGDLINGSLTNFPVYVNLNQLPGEFFDHVRSDGGDIRVTRSNGTTLAPREIVNINTTSNAGELHFLANSLTLNTDKDFYIYYGNSEAEEPLANSQYGAYNVWNGTYSYVYHFDKKPFGVIRESSKTQLKGFSDGAMNGTHFISGMVGNGYSFDGSNDYIKSSPMSTFGSATKATVSAWIRRSASNQNIRLGVYEPGGFNIFGIGSSGGNIIGYVDNAVNYVTNASNDTNWHHTSLVFNGSGATGSDKLKLYFDSSTGSNSITGTIPSMLSTWFITVPVRIGTINNSDFHKGSMDEVRFSTKAFSKAWVTTEYNNQSIPSYFLSSAGEEESNGLAAIAFSPIDDGYSLRDDNFTITFSKIADIQTGNIVIKKAGDNSTVETIDVTSGQVTGNGTTQITFNPNTTLTNGTSYYVQIDSGAFKDTSGNSYPGISDTSTWSFTAARWYDNNWPYRVRLTIDKDKVPGDLTNFPVYVNLNQMPDHFFNNVKADGSDIRVTLANGVGLVPREIVKINTTTNAGEMHFQAKGTLSGTSDTTYFVYYGNSKTTEPLANSQFGKYNVWNGTYNHVYHLSSAPFGEVPTSTKNQAYKGYVMGTSGMNGRNLVAGTVSNGVSFDGSNDYISHGMITDFSNTSKLTMSAWVKRESSGQEIRLGQTADVNSEVVISSTATTIKTYVDNISTVSVVSNDTNWHHVITVFNGNLATNGERMNMYFDSNEYLRTATTSILATQLPNLFGTTYPFYTGYAASGYHQGSIDELRIVNKAITANWAITEYNNQYSPSTFYAIPSAYDLSPSPMAIAFNPADNGYGDKNQNLVITFNRPIDVQTGNVTIKKVSDNSTIETIDVTGGLVTGDGTNTITINPATTLTNGTEYYVQIDSSAFDDTLGNSYPGISDTSTWNFTVSRWYDSSWLYRLKLTVDHNMVAGNLTSFPVYVKLGNFPDHFFNNVKADGGDIRVTLANGLGLVPREIVRIDTTNNAGEMHFKASGTLSSTADTDFYVYYGNSGATEPAANSSFGEQKVWNGIYSFVYHLGDDPTGVSNDVLNSTLSSGDGHTNGTMAAASAGQLDKALTFDGTNDLATTFSSYMAAFTKFTISSWVKRNGSGYNIRMGQYDMGGSYITIYSSADTIRAAVNNSTLGEVYTMSNDTNWHHVMMVFNGSASSNGDRLKIYFDGSASNSTVSPSAVPAATGFSMSAFYLGYAPNSWTYHRGMIDETRVVNRVLSPDWILTEYRNQSSPNSFYSVAGTPASTLDVDAPVITSFSPTDNATGVGLTSNLVLTFNEAVSLQTGNIVIYNGAGAIFESIDVQTAAVTGDGTTAITINPAGTFAINSTYYVLIAGTVVEDISGNAFAGIGSNTTWNFSTNDATSPTVLNYSPPHNAILTQRFAGLSIIFSEAVQAGAGNIVIKKVSDDTTVQTISIASAEVSGNQVLIPMPSKLLQGIQFYVQIDTGAIEDLSGNAYTGINDTTTWRFRTSTSENSLFF